MNRISLVTALLLISALVVGCGPFKTYFADKSFSSEKKNGKKNDVCCADHRDDRLMYELADRFALMALFADLAYRRELTHPDEAIAYSAEIKAADVSLEAMEKACDYLRSKSAAPKHGLPYKESEDTGEKLYEWERWTGNSEYPSTPCYNSEGLFYETYVKRENGAIEEAVISFRGTENTRGQFLKDWKTNLSGAFGFEPEQYAIAAREIPKVITSLKQASPGIQIYATGHSLGGGLAQQAGYLSKDVLEVFTFNTSPVTNWSSLAWRGDVENAYPVIHRVHNGGEALGGLRSVTTLFTKERYGRHDIGIQIGPKELLKGHSMTLLSCHLSCLVGESGMEARHGLGSVFVKQQMLAEGKMCVSYLVKGQCDVTQSRSQAEDDNCKDCSKSSS
ncbi:MAG: DUF6792 domain-containing protein [Pseudomonadota bacterium]